MDEELKDKYISLYDLKEICKQYGTGVNSRFVSVTGLKEFLKAIKSKAIRKEDIVNGEG